MTVRQPRYSKEEFTQRGNRIYEESVRAQVENTYPGDFVAIDIETGVWEVNEDDFTAVERLYARVPDAQPYLIRIGQPTAYRIGGPRRTTVSL